MEEPSGRSKGILLSSSYHISSNFLTEFINLPIYDIFFHISDIYDCVSFFSCAAESYFISLQLPPVPAQARTYLSMRPNNSIPSLLFLLSPPFPVPPLSFLSLLHISFSPLSPSLSPSPLPLFPSLPVSLSFFPSILYRSFLHYFSLPKAVVL